MKKFVLKLVYLLAPLVLLSFPLDYLISKTLKEDHSFPGEFEVWNDIYRGTAHCDIAIYGSSRAWVQIDSEIIENATGKRVYNFGIDGHNFRLQYLRHLEYLKNNNKPDRILLNVDVFTLEQRKDLYQQEQFLPYMLWNMNIKKYTAHYRGFNKSDYYIPLLRYAGRNKLLEKITSMNFSAEMNEPRYRSKGYRGFDKEWDIRVDSLLASGEKYTIDFLQESMELFEKFLKECVENEIVVTLVYAPEYIDGQHFVLNREVVMNYYRRMAHTYGLIFLDYSGDELSFEKDKFYNASHLNLSGSQIFSRKLSRDLIEIVGFEEL